MGKRKRKAQRKAPPPPTIPERSQNHRTASNPWEASRDDEDWDVDKVTGEKYEKGLRLYHVDWKGTDSNDQAWAPTWEPMENLVGSADAIRQFRGAREKEEHERKAKIAAERQARYVDPFVER